MGLTVDHGSHEFSDLRCPVDEVWVCPRMSVPGLVVLAFLVQFTLVYCSFESYMGQDPWFRVYLAGRAWVGPARDTRMYPSWSTTLGTPPHLSTG